MSYVRVAYTGDTSGPGTHVHGWISSGGSYFSASTDTMHITSHNYIRIVYHVQSSAVTGELSISDDTVTHTVVLIGKTIPPAPALTAVGPYFPYIPEGTDTCTHLTLINSTGGPDTIHSVSWAHNPNGIFTWDSVSLPYILAAHDTTHWTYCFHAPDNTNMTLDTLRIYFGSGDSSVSRIVYGIATSPLALEGPYFPNDILEGSDTCTQMRIINTSGTADTIESLSWAHNSNGVFVWDTVSLPAVLAAHDTTYYTFCFHAPNNTQLNIDTIVLSYHTSSGNGNVSRLVEATAATPPSDLSLLGPYFPEHTPEGADTCVSMRLINTTSSADTIEHVTWAHNPGVIFVWDTTALPTTLGPHDTTYFTFCYHAPDNTNLNIDTVSIAYRNGTSSLSSSRIVEAIATDTTPPDAELHAIGPYFPDHVPEGTDTCVSHGSVWPLVLINGGSDVDTIESFSWAHDPGSVFSINTSGTTFPFTMASHDTMYWTACFHAPSDTEMHWDTLIIRYHDAYSNDRYVTRVVYGKAVDTSIHTCYGLYAAASAVTNYGDTSYIHLYIHNYLDSSSTLTAIHISGTDDGAFRVDSTGFPNTIGANAYDSVWIKFIPNRTSGSTEYSATAALSFTTNDTEHCHAADVSLVGYMPQTCSDTEMVNFDTTGSKDVSVSGDSGHYYAHRIDFTNNSSSTLRVTAVNWTHSSSHWLVAQIVPPLPDTLAPNASMAVIIHFYGDTSGTTYYDTLALTISGGYADPFGKNTAQSSNGIFYVNLTGHSNAAPAQVALAVTPNAPELRLYPNPSAGVVNMELEGTPNATFEITDVLGNVIASHSGTRDWQWDANSIALPKDGTYFIRATNGVSVVTKRLVLER